MEQTIGIVIDVGAGNDELQNPYYDNKIKVRVPELHNYGPIASGFKEEDSVYTKDEDIPWATITCASLDSGTDNAMLIYKSKHFTVGDTVYVQYEDVSTTQINVVGSKVRYVEGKTNYTGIDVTEMVSQASTFPSALTGKSSSSTDVSDSDDSGSFYNSKGKGSTTSVKNKTQWKTVFGCPFKKKSDYRISATFPAYSGGSSHSGIDLAGSVGTPIYSVGDGVVYSVNGMGSDFGNHVMIDHGVHNGTHFYTLYAHMKTKPYVSKGQKVKGTQLAAPEWKKDTYYSGQRGRDNKVSNPQLTTSKPKDWSKSYMKYFVKSGSDYKSVTAVPQEGTQVGIRGYTGHVIPRGPRGTHLHFMITDSPGYVCNRQVGSGHIKNPQNYISF